MKKSDLRKIIHDEISLLVEGSSLKANFKKGDVGVIQRSRRNNGLEVKITGKKKIPELNFDTGQMEDEWFWTASTLDNKKHFLLSDKNFKKTGSQLKEVAWVTQQPSGKRTMNVGIEYPVKGMANPKFTNYTLEKDEWFRKEYNPGQGYGLMIRDIKFMKPIYVTTSHLSMFKVKSIEEAENFGPVFIIHRVKMTHWSHDEANQFEYDSNYDKPENWSTDPVWLWVSSDFKFDDVAKWIKRKAQSKVWIP